MTRKTRETMTSKTRAGFAENMSVKPLETGTGEMAGEKPGSTWRPGRLVIWKCRHHRLYPDVDCQSDTASLRPSSSLTLPTNEIHRKGGWKVRKLV